MNRLKEIRKSRGLAMWHLASICRINPSVLSAIERYDYRVSVKTKSRIAEALDAEVEEVWPSEDQTEKESL